jgi:hypothetical protein
MTPDLSSTVAEQALSVNKEWHFLPMELPFIRQAALLNPGN